MPAELYYKPGFGRRIRKITAAAAASLIKINNALFTSIGVAPVPDAPTVLTAPVISGGPAVGATLTVTPGTYSESPTITRQWFANSAPLADQNGLTLDTTGMNPGDVIECQETATNAGGSVQSTSNQIVLT